MATYKMTIKESFIPTLLELAQPRRTTDMEETICEMCEARIFVIDYVDNEAIWSHLDESNCDDPVPLNQLLGDSRPITPLLSDEEWASLQWEKD